MVRAMLNRPAAAHAELQDLSDGLEVKAARRWNPALHPRDSKGRFIETGGTVRLWGGQLARVLRALPNNRVLVQDQTRPNEFSGRRHTTLANWVTMVARPDGSAPTDNEDKVQKEDQKRDQDPARGNGVARDDDGDLNTPNDPHDVDDRGRPIGEDDHPVGPRENDDQDEPADGKHPINVRALPNTRHMAGGRFSDTAAVRQHFLDLAERPDTKPKMAQFLRSVAGDDDLRTSADGRLAILRDDETGRWYLTATGTGQRMNMAGDFATPEEAADFAAHLNRTAPTEGDRWRTWSGFDFSDPNLDGAASTWRSSNGENIQAAIQRARREFDSSQTPAAPADNGNAPETVSRGDLKPGDRVKVTVNGSDIEWPASTRDQDLPETVTVEGTIAPTYDSSKWTPLLDATLTAPDGTVMTSGDSVRLMRTPNQVAVSGHTDGHTPEKVRADRVHVGDVVAGGEFGHVVTGVRRYPGGRTFTTRHLGGRRETHQFGADAADTMNVIPRARRRPEDVKLDTPGRTQQHPNSTDAKRAAASILDDWAKVNELVEKQWPDGAPEEFQALARHMQNVTDAPKGADGYQQNAEAMRGALASLDEMDTDSSLDRDMVRALHRLEEHLDANVDRFAADARAIAAKKQKPAVSDAPPKPDVPEPAASEPLKYAWDNPENLVTLTMPAAVANHVTEEGTWATQDPDTRKALEEAKTGKNGTLRVTAPIEVHHMLLEAAEVLSGNGSDVEPHEIRGYNNYAKRVHEADAKLREASAANTPKPPTPEPNSGIGDAEGLASSGVTPSAQPDPGVTLSPDEVNAPAEASHASKAPSAMDDGEIRDEIVSLMEREMANGGELEGTDRTRLRVLEAEEARRAGRKPPEEPKPKPKGPQEEPGGLFDVASDEQQRFVADPNNPDDQADDPTGTPDMFAAHEGRDTSRLRPPQSRKPADFQPGDRFVDNDGRTHTVKEPPLRTPRGRIRVVDEDGGEHFIAPDKELRVLHADEDAPAVPEANAPGTNAPEGDGPSADTPDSPTPTVEPSEADTPTPDATGTPAAEPAGAPADQVRIDHSGTGTTVRFPTPNGMVSDEEFAVLRRLGFKGSRDRTQPRFFYLPSNMTLSRREDKVRQLKQWLDGRGVAYHAPQDEAERPDLTPEQLEQLKGRYHAPPGTWATTDFQPGDEVWTGHRWETIDSLGPKNMRLQGRGATPYDSVLARRRGSEIRTMFDAPADDGTPRPGTDDPSTMRDGQIAQELANLRGATLPEGNEPSARAVRRQVATRIQALTTAQSEREYARRRDESNRRDQARLVRDVERLARLKGEQVQGRDGALIGAVYKDLKTKKWVYVDRDGRTPTRERYTSRAAAITAFNKINDARNRRSGEGWKFSGWDDVQPGDTVRVPEIGRPEGASARTVTNWSEPLEVSEIRRGDMGQVIITGRRNGEDVQLEVDRATASFGTSKPGTVPDREHGDAGGGMDWRQMRPDDFGQDERPTPSPDQNQPRPTDGFGTPDLIDNGAPDTPQASPDNSQTPETSNTGAIGVDLNHAHYEEPGTPSGREAREERWALMESWNASPLNARLMSGPADSDRHRLAAAVQAAEADPQLDDQMWGPQRRAQQRLRDAADALLANLGDDTENDEDRATLQKLRDATDLHLNRMAVTSEGYTDPLLDRIREARKREEESNRGNSDAPVAPAAPIRNTSPADMTDEDIDAELEELQAWQNRHVAPSGEGPRVQGNAMVALSPVASRRGELHEEQRQRELARRDKGRNEKEKQDRAAALARAEIGKRSEDGTYPVTVDGNHAGSVQQLGRKWHYTRVNEPSGPLEHSSRAAAVAALVRNIDVRREMDEARAREATRRAEREARAAAAAQPDHGPAYSNELRARMADIGDDIATLQNHAEGIDDQDRMQRLADLIQRVEGGHTDDLQADLRQIRDEGAWLEEQFSNPDLPYETRTYKSWATAARMKAQRALEHPDFQQGTPDQPTNAAPEWADDLGDNVWLDRPKRGGGPQNIYVDGQIEGLLGRDKPQGRYYWWRPGGQTSEGRYDTPEEAARGFAHDMREQGLPSLSNGNDDAQSRRGRTLQTQRLFNAGMNAVGGESLPEMQELNERLDRADSADDPDAELRDIADRIDALADQYELAGPQGELAAERFRQAALAARGEHDDRANRGGDDHSTDGESNTGQDDNQVTPADDGDDNAGEPNPDDNEGEQRQDQDDEDNSRQRNDTNPDGGPNGGGADAPDSSGDNGNSNDDNDPDHTDDEENAPNLDEENQYDEEHRRRRRRRNNSGGAGGPGEGGPGGVGLPHLDLPDFNVPIGDGSNDTAGGHGHDVDSLRNAWRTGKGLTADEDTPERRAHLADLADREGLALSPQGGLALWPEQQDDGTTVWRFAQARNGSGLPGITLTSDDPEEARTLAGRFEELTDANGDPFDWHRPQDRASVAAWRDGEGRNLPQAIRAVQDDYQQERAGAFNLPHDLTDVEDDDLEAAMRQGLGPEDELRVMAEMDRRDGYVDQRVRAAAQTTPPANADEAEREGRAMDAALRFGDTDVTQPAPATPGRLRREFDSLDEERFQAATQATGGRMLSAEAEAAGIDPRAVFSGGKYSNKQARELASPELNQWLFGDDKTDGNGRLTYPQYRAREADRVLRAEFADWDEARYQQAVDATNGYLFRREYKYANPGFDERELFSGGSLSARDRWRQYVSEELDEWYDLNGGRQTFAQFKEARRANDRAERQQYEEEQRAANAPRFSNVDELRQRLQEGTFDDRGVHNNLWARDNRDDLAANRTLELSPGGRLAIARYKGSDGRSSWHVLAPGSMASLYTFTSQPDALRMTQVMEGIRDADGNPFPWDAPDAMDRARAFRGPDGESLGAALARSISEEYAADENHRNHRKFQAGQAVADEGWLNQHYDEWRTRQEADGYTIPVAPGEVQGGDELSTIAGTRGALSPNSARVTVADRGAGAYLPESTGGIGLPMGSLGDYAIDRGSSTRIIDPNGNQVSERPQNFQEFRTIDDPVRPRLMRRPRPDELPDVPAAEEPEAPPEPIAGQPAHWARVGDLAEGDMVRMNGAAANGRPVQRAGYVQTTPQLIDVTRRGRSEQMWRTWVTANPDGTGEAGNVYTSANANAARAEALDDVVPGSPASGAQASVRAGAVPDQIPADHDGRALFPGSTVHGTDGREGTVTGAADTSVSVHWSDGDDDPALPATTLTVTDGQRPDGWTADGHRVTTQNVVSDRSGALLGPVDDVDGDNVTIHTADGTVTRSAGDLRVTGQVRDDEPATAPVAGIDEPAAGDLKDGDVIVLDLDGQLVTAAITSPPHRDGDRVTLQYADTTTGEIGEIDVDARAVLPRAQGPDGGAPDLGPDNAPEPDDDLTVHPTPHPVDPVTGPTVDPDLDSSDRNVIGDHADGPDTDPDAHQAAVRITADLPVTPEQASALATQLRATADPSTPEGRAAMRAANRLDEAAGRALPPGLDRPRPSNVGQLADGDLVALPGDANGAPVRIYRVLDVTDAPGGIRSLHLEDSAGRRTHRIEHGAMPAWQLPEPEPEPVTPPDADDTPDTLSTPDEPTMPVAQVRPGSLRRGDVIDAPVSRTGYQLNGHRRLTIISEPQRNGWWMQLTGVDEDGNVHDFGLHNGRAMNVYDRNRPTPALPPAGTPRDPNQTPQADVDRIVSDHGRAHAARIIDEAVAGTEPPGDIHALREAIAQRLTPEALTGARQTTRQEGSAALDAAGITGRDRANAQRRLRNTRTQAHNDTVRAALRTINDLEPLNGESNEDLAARARDLLRLIPNQVAGRPATDPDADPDVTRAVTGHTDDAVNALLQQLQAAGVDPGDAERIARILTQQMAGSRQATARRIARRVATANPDAGRQPGLLARIVAALVRLAKRFGELVKQGARTIAEKYQDSRDRLARLRAFLGRMVRRVRQWPESRRLARLHRAVNLPDTDGESLAARITHWAGLMPEPGRFGQAQRRLTFWRPTTWARLASGRLPDRSDRIQWTPDRAADGGPGLTGLRHMAALRMAGHDVDTDVTRRLSAALGDDFGDDPHATLQHADDYVAASERRLVNLQAVRSSATIPGDPDLDIEITAARSELAAARREYADLRTRYAAAVPDAVAASLADIRDMGPEGNSAIVFGPDTDPDAERAVRGVQRLIPRSWLNTPEARRITAVNGTQGRYEPEGQRVTVADLADEGLGTAGYALGQHFAGRLSDLDAAQRAFWFSRTHTGRPGARRMQRSPWDRLFRRQQTQPETGDTLARSLQSMFSGDWYLDDDLRAFLLGLLAMR